MRTPSRIPTTAQIRQLEADYIKQCGPSWSQVLMEIAGRGAAEHIGHLWQPASGPVLVVCGRGNNGGDGFVIARYLHLWSIPVTVALMPDKDHGDDLSTAEATTNKVIAEDLGITIVEIDNHLDELIESSGLVVDALFGTGLSRNLEGAYKKAVDAINRGAKSVLSVDMPSGINSDSGQIMGTAVRADMTVTFGYLKPGHLNHPGAGLAGDLKVVDIGLPEVENYDPTIELLTSEHVRKLLPPRADESNKGSFGTVLTIAGSLGMSGASLLSSLTALRTGAGLSLLATPKSLVANLPPGEVIYVPLPETSEQSISPAAMKPIEEKLEKAKCVILGPGLSMHDETVEFVQQFVKEALSDGKKSAVVDADALNAIAKNPDIFPDQADHIIITPHPKELSRLTEQSVQDIQADRVKSALSAAKRFNCIVVLKGSRTVVASPDGHAYINPTGNPGMATGGSGDVLSGTIGGLLAQGLSAFDAAAAGVYLHGFAGDLAAQHIGEVGIIAGDIGETIPAARVAVEKGEMSKLEHSLLGYPYEVSAP